MSDVDRPFGCQTDNEVTDVGRTHKDPESLIWMQVTDVGRTHKDPGSLMWPLVTH